MRPHHEPCSLAYNPISSLHSSNTYSKHETCSYNHNVHSRAEQSMPTCLGGAHAMPVMLGQKFLSISCNCPAMLSTTVNALQHIHPDNIASHLPRLLALRQAPSHQLEVLLEVEIFTPCPHADYLLPLNSQCQSASEHSMRQIIAQLSSFVFLSTMQRLAAYVHIQ